MKKIILSAMAILAFGFTNAQDDSSEGFSKGNLFVSGSVGFSSSKTGDFKSNSTTLSPALGYFVTENFAVGVMLDVTSGKLDNGVAESKTSGFGADLFGRYYFTPASKFSVFGQGAVGIGSTKDTDTDGDEFKSKTFGVNVGVGVNYFLSNHFAIEAGWAGLGYNTDDNGGNGAEKTNSFGLAVDLSAINFGLLYKF